MVYHLVDDLTNNLSTFNRRKHFLVVSIKDNKQ